MNNDVGVLIKTPLGRFRDLTGVAVGKLFVLTRTSVIKKGVTHWLCKCSCGKLIIRKTGYLTGTATPSCGCYMHDFGVENGTKHGMSRTLTYGSWSNAKSRCYRLRDKNYLQYGGRGIKMCDRWKDSFENFYEDMGDIPVGMTLDRRDVNGEYSPENCRWATWEEQAQNRRITKFIVFEGRRVPLSKVSALFSLSYSDIYYAVKSKGEENLPSYIQAHYAGDYSSKVRELGDNV